MSALTFFNTTASAMRSLPDHDYRGGRYGHQTNELDARGSVLTHALVQLGLVEPAADQQVVSNFVICEVVMNLILNIYDNLATNSVQSIISL